MGDLVTMAGGLVVTVEGVEEEAAKEGLLQDLSLPSSARWDECIGSVPPALMRSLAVRGLTAAEVYRAQSLVIEHSLQPSRPPPRLPMSVGNERAVIMQLRRLLAQAPAHAQAALGPALAADRHRFLCTPKEPWVVDEGDALFQSVAESVVGKDAGLSLRRFPSTGRGIASTRDRSDGEEVLCIPVSSTLTAKRFRERWAQTPAATALSGVSDDTALALALLVACAEDTSSIWATYSRLLGEETTGVHCVYWDEATRGALMGTGLSEKAEECQRTLREEYGRLGGLLGLLLPSQAAPVTWDSFRWAFAVVATRALLVEFEEGSGSCGVLVPVADMLNHHVRAPLAAPVYDKATDSLLFLATAPIPADSQLFLYYGPNPCWEHLLQYGFLDEERLCSEPVRIDVEPPDDLDKPGDMTVVQKAMLLVCGGYTTSHFLSPTCLLSPRLVGAYRVCLLPSIPDGGNLPDFERCPAPGDTEREVWTALVEMLRSVRNSLPGTVDDDVRLICSEAGPLRPGLLRLRLHHKCVIEDALLAAKTESALVGLRLQCNT